DQALIYCAAPDAQARLARALQGVEYDAGPELVAYIIRLIRLAPLDRLLRAQLITLLGLLSSETALAALMDLLAETDPTLRQAVNQSMAYAGAAALAPLQLRLRDRRELIRTRAAEALTYISETTPDTADAALAAARMGLNSADPRQRAAAAATLGSLRASEALDALIASLGDGERAVRVAAARALGQIGGQRARAALRKHGVHTDAALRIAVAQALGNSPDPLSTPILLQLLEDSEPRVRAAAAMALGTLGDERAVGPLREHVADADPWAQNAAISALRRLGRG
ncbi:MAG TPA: HEAT repeat domain-containing protein, partial [Ktedonobacterales bacterium]|nr:HEAT repeat domain-containing protein [Ktedonobacterales bacterium]